ncbi:hypothetical protein B0H13DRAFT_2488986 [Mycena leptocephala]|nr:hypothetical protein B0H13DRAFT_2488986 [Mycena leptocephala]
MAQDYGSWPIRYLARLWVVLGGDTGQEFERPDPDDTRPSFAATNIIIETSLPHLTASARSMQGIPGRVSRTLLTGWSNRIWSRSRRNEPAAVVDVRGHPELSYVCRTRHKRKIRRLWNRKDFYSPWAQSKYENHGIDRGIGAGPGDMETVFDVRRLHPMLAVCNSSRNTLQHPDSENHEELQGPRHPVTPTDNQVTILEVQVEASKENSPVVGFRKMATATPPAHLRSPSPQSPRWLPR